MIMIRKVYEIDSDNIWQMFSEIVDEGSAFCSDNSVSRDEALRMWIDDDSYVGCLNNDVVAAYSIFPLHRGRGSHIACASYMVKRQYRGNGYGLILGEHSLKTAKEMGYIAMQFNCVASANNAAVSLWRKLGFEIKATIPKGFNHKDLGLINSYIMYREL